MSSYHRSDKEEWDELMEENREGRRHHDDSEFWDIVEEELGEGNTVVVCRNGDSSSDAWFWDDDREGVARRDMMMKSEADMVMSRRRKPSNGWDW